MKKREINLTGYPEFVAELKARILSARISVSRAVNRDLILLYWDIGRGIIQKQQTLGWGDAVVETLAKDLRTAFPTMGGFAARSVWNMRRFYLAYAAPETHVELLRRVRKKHGTLFLPQAVAESSTPTARSKVAAAEDSDPVRRAVAEVPWGHHLLLLDKVKELKARLYYLQATAQLGWSRNVLLNQIKARAYERSLAAGKTHNFPVALPVHLAEQAEEALKSSYNLEFLGIGRAMRERELEQRLLERVRDFILELGYGFCFIGNQYRLTLGRKEYFIDLLFYHRFLKALVAIELKVSPFVPEFAGKMDFYLNLLNATEKAPEDNPSIGIILCAEKDALEVEFSLKTKTNPIGVAEYQLVPKLPKELQGKLPNERELRKLLQTEIIPPIQNKP